jgi:hypothetical protein
MDWDWGKILELAMWLTTAALSWVAVIGGAVWLVRQFGPERLLLAGLSMLGGVGIIHILTILKVMPQVMVN